MLHGTNVTLDEAASPTFIGLRQREFCFELAVNVTVDDGEAGVSVYMNEDEHYDIAVAKTKSGFEAVLKLNIGGIKHKQASIPLPSGNTRLRITADNLTYNFYLAETLLGSGRTKYLSSEVSGGFTGVVLGLYSVGENTAVFENFTLDYQK